jgi:glycosyltransferase involved in cell wall biosynthesis
MLLREKIYYYNNTPKITSIIPVFNASKTIKAAIRSIQNQNMDDIEIILVDDVSTDNSTSIINELMIEDRRIKLIKNKRNRGILYSRSIGALNAKGKYIMALDNDDLFINGIFNKCYEEAEKNNLDIYVSRVFRITNL